MRRVAVFRDYLIKRIAEDGISHNEIENATPEDCAAGCQVLLDVVLERAGAVD